MNIDYWATDRNEEEHAHTSIDDAVVTLLDSMAQDQWPETLSVWGYRRQDKPGLAEIGCYAKNNLDILLDSLDDDYGGLHESTDSTPEMMARAVEFVQRVLEDYVVYWCEEVPEARIVINVQEWVRAHRPEWLEEGGGN